VLPDRILVGIGVRWRTELPRAAITSIVAVARAPDDALDLSLLDPAVLVTLREPVIVCGLLGRRRRADRLVLSVDEPARLVALA
jgi:hypothetical protein